MLEIKPVPFMSVQEYFQDFQDKALHYEMPPDNSEFLGAFVDGEFAGYFNVLCYSDATLEILQGYLKPKFRHARLHIHFLRKLETMAKKKGIRKILLQTSRSLRAYSKFMSHVGFKPLRTIYTKEV